MPFYGRTMCITTMSDSTGLRLFIIWRELTKLTWDKYNQYADGSMMKKEIYRKNLRPKIDEIISNRALIITFLYGGKNVSLMNSFHKAGVLDKYDVLEATWKVCYDRDPDEIKDDFRRSGYYRIVWKQLSLSEILENLDLSVDEFEEPDGPKASDKIYFKLSFDLTQKVICLSLHVSELQR